MTTKSQHYGRKHQELRERFLPIVLAGGVKCARCGELIAPGEPWDLGHDDHDRNRYTGPEHRACNRATAGRRWTVAAPVEPERDGLAANDPRWNVPWLKGLRRPPRNAVWPRLMSVPHPSAVGSLGPEFIRWAEKRSGRPLRWWQKLVATRALEIDSDGKLVWETVVLSMARQLGKSWLLRELLFWRIHQGERFGEPQDVLHTGKDLAVCKEVQRPARVWAKGRQSTYKVREVNGQEEIELLADGSRWMLRAKEAVYGYAVSLGAADEAWKVRASSVDEGLTPTMAEREQPQLWLVSTAHRLATSLMLIRRQTALLELETGTAELLIEWSAPAEAELDDRVAWRQASPHWTPQRERLIGRRLEALHAGEIEDPEEPDPEQSFRSQWLNQWPRKLSEPDGKSSPLLPHGAWTNATEAVTSDGPVWVALEDDYGRGAAVAAVARLEDGRYEIDGWLCEDWDAAVRDALRLGELREVRQFIVGASLLDRWDGKVESAGTAETRRGLALFRDLVLAGQVVHDGSTVELDTAVGAALVREGTAGLALLPRGPTHLVRAMVWTLLAAHRPVAEPAVY
jgi:hypothetical protein